MFSLDCGMSYWLYNKPVSMCMGFNGLSGIVCNRMGMDIRCGDVFVFINTTRNRMKILHQEECGLVLYSLRMDIGRIKPLFSVTGDEVICSAVSHEAVIHFVLGNHNKQKIGVFFTFKLLIFRDFCKFLSLNFQLFTIIFEVSMPSIKLINYSSSTADWNKEYYCSYSCSAHS